MGIAWDRTGRLVGSPFVRVLYANGKRIQGIGFGFKGLDICKTRAVLSRGHVHFLGHPLVVGGGGGFLGLEQRLISFPRNNLGGAVCRLRSRFSPVPPHQSPC